MKRASPLQRTTIFILPLSLFGFAAPAGEVSAQNVMTVAALPGVPIAQEPHHHLVFQNSFVNVYEIEVAPGDATLMHQHYYDNLFVVFGDADLTNTVAGKKPEKLGISDLGIHFAREPYAHIIANNGKVPFRNITVELLQTQGQVKNFSSSINDALGTTPPDGSGIREARVLETDEVQVVAVAIPSSTAWSPPHDGHALLVVMLDKINDGAGPTEKNSPFPAGMLAWFPADTELRVPNESDERMKLMILEFKDTPAKVE
jgi:hypothetical protein